MQLEIGQEVDGYLIKEIIGQGGMGIVYKALDVGLDIDVALKVINPSMATDEHLLRRFQSEAQTLAKVNSKNIVSVKRFTNTENGRFIVMEYVKGGDLSDVMQKGPLPLPDVLDIIRQLLTAFQDAHSVGIVHRDIKPANIMITESDVVKVTDFGLAKIRSAETTRTMTQGVMGTLYYMSPEQLEDGDVDQRSDLWSLGVVFYELLVGARPFDATYEASVMYAILSEPVSFPEPVQSAIPGEIQTIITRLLEKKQVDRYQDATAVLIDIDAFRKNVGEPHTKPIRDTKEDPIRREPVIESPPKPVRPWRRIAITGIGLLLFGAVVLYAIFKTIPEGGNGGEPENNGNFPDSTMLSLYTSPSGATVYLNEEEVRQSPSGNYVLDGRYDSVSVRLANSGYVPIDTVLSANMAHRLVLTKEREKPVRTATATITVTAIPSGDIYIDDRPVEADSPEVVNIGRRKITCRYGGRELQATFRLAANERLEKECYFGAAVYVQGFNRAGDEVAAKVLLNGERGWDTEKWFFVGPGIWNVSITKPGWDSRLLEGPGDSLVITPSFTETKHRLKFELTKRGN
ncbi:MAG: hypothetical protein BMS9Abin05_2238 [Rhodothermia bacterium]|nr:MAG: hypothetical protein BMS9Abin05_2238 [Rhodothermia bacterium]